MSHIEVRRDSKLIDNPITKADIEYNIGVLENEITHINDQIESHKLKASIGERQLNPEWLRKAADAARFKQELIVELKYQINKTDDMYYREIYKIVKNEFDDDDWHDIEDEAHNAIDRLISATPQKFNIVRSERSNPNNKFE